MKFSNLISVRVFVVGIVLASLVRGQTPVAGVEPAASVNAANDLPALRVAVTAVEESRDGTGRGNLNLRLSITGVDLPSVGVKYVSVTKAADSLGNVLGPGAVAPSTKNSRRPIVAGGGDVSRLIGEASLAAPGRKAESLAYVEGTIDLFLASGLGGATIRVPHVLQHPGRIDVAALAKEGIEFHFLPDQASYDRAKNQVEGFRAEEPAPSFPNTVAYYFHDRAGRLVDFEFQDANGVAISSKGDSWNGDGSQRTGTIRLRAPLPADAQLVFFVTTPETFTTVPFRVENIALP